MPLLAIFLPPVYFLVRGRWGAFAGTLLFLAAALYCCVTILLAPFLPLFWAAASLWAFLDLRSSARRQSSSSQPAATKR